MMNNMTTPKAEAMEKAFIEFNGIRFYSIQERIDHLEGDGWTREELDAESLCPLCVESVHREVGVSAGDFDYCHQCAYKVADFYKDSLLSAEKERDELKANRQYETDLVATLTSERDEARAKVDAMVQADPRQIWNCATVEAMTFLKESEKWIQHSTGCPQLMGLVGSGPCTCGLDNFKSRAFLAKQGERI